MNQDLINKAWFFAARAHKEQNYPGEELPYLTHIGNVVLEVMGVVHTLKNKDLAVLCAILHDTIEDTAVSYEDIKREFGEMVANGVLALSKDTKLPKKIQMQDSLVRIKQEPKEIWVVKMADRIANLQKPPLYWGQEKIQGYKNEALLIYKELYSANELLAKRLAKKISLYNKD